MSLDLDALLAEVEGGGRPAAPGALLDALLAAAEAPRLASRQQATHPPRPSMLRGVDLFAGAGGFTLGAIQAGCPITLAIERNPVAVQTGRRHGHRVYRGDVGQMGLYEDVMWGVDVLIGGPPCQPFSTMGHGAGKYDARDGFPLVLDAVDALTPRRMVMENVRGFVSQRHTAYRNQVLRDLGQRFKYVGVWELNAKDFGVPQDRIRIFVWGSDVLLQAPTPTHGPQAGRSYVSVRQALPGLQAPAIHVRSTTAKSRSIDQPSPTVATKGTIYTATRPGLIYGRDPAQGRRLTPPELKTLQGFPGAFTFSGNLSEQYTQIGNAVPPPLGKAVVEAVTAGIRSEPLPPNKVVAALKRDNPSALLFEPRELWDAALVGVTNASPFGDLVAIYDFDKLLDLAIGATWAQSQGEADPQEVFQQASDHVHTNMMGTAGLMPNQPLIFHLEDPIDWQE